MATIEIDEVSIEHMITNEPTEEGEEEVPPCTKVRNVLNVCLTVLITINLALEFEGQSADFAFLTDSVDCGLFLCCFFVLVFTIATEIKYGSKLSLPTIIDIVLFLIYGSGMVYEGATAESFGEFLSAETEGAKVLRTFKYLRLFLVIVHMKHLWEDTYLLIICVCQAVWRVKPIIIIWAIAIVTMAIMGYHLHTGNTLVDANGNLDPTNGHPHQVSFSTFYHSLIFTLLTVYDEEWDFLMFQEYLGSGVCIVVWQSMSMIIGYIIFSQFLTCTLSR